MNKYDSLKDDDNNKIKINILDTKHKQYVFQENINNTVEMQSRLERNHLRNKYNKEIEYLKMLDVFYATFITSQEEEEYKS